MILVINCGSSSLKFALINPIDRETILSGLAEKLGQANAAMTIKHQAQKVELALRDHTHEAALAHLVEYLEQQGLKQSVKAVGHRVVHGGETFKEGVLLTDRIIQEIEACSHLAPLHNPANLLGIKAALTAFSGLRQVAIFDTAFHQTLPEVAYLYAVPMQWYREYGVRRYGFHGTSHRYVAEEAAKSLNISSEQSAFISVHLGNGASVAAILNGQSVDTSMGLTPLEGLLMGTRSGDVDPGLHAFMAKEANLTIEEITEILNKKSGLLGISELSNDCRILEEAASNQHRGAVLALDMFAFRVAKYIGAMAISLPRIDALIFTGGIGENSSFLRAKILTRLSIFGFIEDHEANLSCVRGKAGLITIPESTVALVINTNEELVIAKETAVIAS